MRRPPHAPAAGFELKGWHVLSLLLGFFGVVIAVNGLFVALAVQSFPGEDVRRSYMQGLAYNETLAERRAQRSLGWRASAALSPVGADAVVEVRLVDQTGAPISTATVSGVLRRPLNAADDRTLAFTALGEGRYQARVQGLEAGQWDLRARAHHDQTVFEAISRLSWRSSTPDQT